VSKRDSVSARIEGLRQEIHYHDWRYYVLNDPVISDYEYDQLMAELLRIEDEHPELVTPDSPSQRVGGQPTEGFAQVQHTIPMLSLDNTYSAEELFEFDRRVARALQREKVEYVVELKIDGVAVSLRYEGGHMVQGSTRGDGEVGDDVTANLRTIRSIPLILMAEVESLRDCEVRGEVYLPRSRFEELNREREERGEPLFANPRNATAGTLKQLDPAVVSERRLDIFIHTLAYQPEARFGTHLDALDGMARAGFRVAPVRELCQSMDDVVALTETWCDQRNTLSFDTDGIVVKVNSFSQQVLLGSTSRSPRWAIAYKYPAQQATTMVRDIKLQVGRIGTVTPVAVLEPVYLSGSTISHATLHNEDEVKRKDVRVGDTVIIEKGGEVIPKVVKVVKEKRRGDERTFRMPSTCPVCGSRLARYPGEVAVRCENVACPAQVRARIEYFASRRGMDIDGLGTKLVKQMVDSALINDYGDLYSLQFEDLVSLERMAEKSARNLLQSIDESRRRPLANLIMALGIRHVGSRAAELLADAYHSIDQLARASEEELGQIPEIGPVIAESVVRFFRDENNRAVLDKLRRGGVQMEGEAEERARPLAGKTFVLTGTLGSLTRDEATERITALGGRVASSVSGKTDFVVVGENAGSKYRKARDMGVPILNEDEFLAMLG
jgi:DNA ligase (NAD+)